MLKITLLPIKENGKKTLTKVKIKEEIGSTPAGPDGCSIISSEVKVFFEFVVQRPRITKRRMASF